MSVASHIDNYEVLKTIHKGATSRIKLAKEKGERTKFVALKIYKTTAVGTVQCYQSSLETLRGYLPHPHIPEIHHFSPESMYHSKCGTSWPVMYLSTELCTGGTLYDYLALSGGLTENQLKTLCSQILSALECLHNVASGGFNPDKLILSADYTLKITHFTLKTDLNSNRNQAYLAPEQLANGQIDTEKCDIFALGLILYNLLFARSPFPVADLKNPDYSTFQTNKSQFWQQKRGKFVSPSPYFINLIDLMLSHDAKNRPNFCNLQHHPWFVNVLTRDMSDIQAFIIGGFNDMRDAMARKRTDTRKKRAIQRAGSRFKGENCEFDTVEVVLPSFVPYKNTFFRLFLLFTPEQTVYILRNTMRDRTGYSVSEEFLKGCMEIVHKAEGGRETHVKISMFTCEDMIVLEATRIAGCFFTFLSLFYLLKAELDYSESLFSL